MLTSLAAVEHIESEANQTKPFEIMKVWQPCWCGPARSSSVDRYGQGENNARINGTMQASANAVVGADSCLAIRSRRRFVTTDGKRRYCGTALYRPCKK
jgi:hypothetical protein